jgi:DNA polymerase III epsilon subunit-like protein
MRVFLDFEASSLAQDSYPIEVGWVTEDGQSESHLIRPAPDWTDWDPTAERVHGLSRARLEAEGEPHDRVAHRMLEALGAHEVFASAPSWDGKWLSVLLRKAGLPRHALRLKDTDVVHLEAASEILRRAYPDDEVFPLATRLLAAAQARIALKPPEHRALADAQREREVWLEIRRLAEAEALRLAPP